MFATAGSGGTVVYAVVFLALVAVWLAARPAIAQFLARWGHILMPAVLIGIGLFILVEGGAVRR